MQTTAERLKTILEIRNLKQSDVIKMAEPYCQKYMVKLNKSDLSQFVNGKVIPGQFKLAILALALDVNEAWLMGYDNVPMERTLNIEDSSSQSFVTEYFTPSELSLLYTFRKLNQEGQEKILSYASDLESSGKYKKSNPSILGQKQA